MGEKMTPLRWASWDNRGIVELACLPVCFTYRGGGPPSFVRGVTWPAGVTGIDLGGGTARRYGQGRTC